MKRTNIEFMIGWLDALRRDEPDAVKAMLDANVSFGGVNAASVHIDGVLLDPTIQVDGRPLTRAGSDS